jgi:hypothetical protein
VNSYLLLGEFLVAAAARFDAGCYMRGPRIGTVEKFMNEQPVVPIHSERRLPVPLDHTELATVAIALNNRPRKTLG